MIRNLKRWQQWEDAHIASEPPNPARAFAIAEALCREAKVLGVWDQPFTVESISHKIELARALHVSRTARATGQSKESGI
jgi:hypothetical protein